MIQTITNNYILFVTIGTLLMQFLVTTYLSVKEKQARDFERARYNEEHDALTGLYNYEAYGKEIKRLSSSSQDYNVIMFDIDHFKQINDTYGHLEGNGVLQYFGTCLEDYTHTKVDDSALVYRFGGEEFCVIMPKMKHERVKKYFLNFQAELKKARYQTEDGRGMKAAFTFLEPYLSGTQPWLYESLTPVDSLMPNALHMVRLAAKKFKTEGLIKAQNNILKYVGNDPYKWLEGKN